MDSIPITLQSLATKSLCIRLIYDWASSDMPFSNSFKNDDSYGTCPNHDWFIWRMYEMQVPPGIVIPNLVQRQIDDNITSILNQVIEWIRCHHSMHFFHDKPASPLNEYLVKLVWNDDRSIDYTSTARNILAGSNFNPMEKFRFACTYCFVAEITNLREMADVAKNRDFKTEPLLVYWSKCLNNELYTIPIPEIVSMEVIMFEKSFKEIGLWSAIEYFFTKLNTDDKLRLYSDLIDHSCGEKYRKELLAKVSDEQWTLACRNSIAKMVKKCAEFASGDDFEAIRHIWRQFKDVVDSKNLASIIEELVPLSMKNVGNFNSLTPLLVEIWSSARDEIKRSAMKGELLRRVGEKCAYLIDHDDEFDLEASRKYDESLDFIRTLLSYESDEKNREMFLRLNLHWLVIWKPICWARGLLEEFVADSRKVANLINETKDSSELRFSCSKLLRIGEFDHFNDIVSFFLSGESDDINEPVSHQYKLTFVLCFVGTNALSNYLYFGDWKRLHEFLEGIFRSTNFEPNEFMILLIRKGFIGNDFLIKKLRRGEMDDVKQFGGAYLAVDERFESFRKRCMVELFRCIFVAPENMIFKRSQVQDFFAWCASDNELIEEHLLVLPELFPRAFVGQLTNCVRDFTFEVSDSMEEFLLWCFPSEEERRCFKRSMIFNYFKYPLIANLLKRRNYRRYMLDWFFDGDANSIESFAAYYKDVKVVEICDDEESLLDDSAISNPYQERIDCVQFYFKCFVFLLLLLHFLGLINLRNSV